MLFDLFLDFVLRKGKDREMIPSDFTVAYSENDFKNQVSGTPHQTFLQYATVQRYHWN